VEIDEFPSLKSWEKRMLERPALRKGRDIPAKNKLTEELKKDPEAIKKVAEHASAWVQSGMKADAEKHK
jgi:glutathione S-transferase